ncbi:TetR family transcriptional regulator [Paraburkholderia susongensis]|uniref:Transcriptional regulator, TetR family n=1 Tax=Paraburkholderia susongensis TaxID=1515439 RepID=A0A1X7LDH9_9BURK|nr:TetR family transcriptional regulator [Paraburkholderia susongensis]SMG51433.1 transcriptional regulator, TetR family [Paraburkholderia susongensis]
MGRWEPNAENRFRAAAIELFGEIGYEQTTVAAIAERAGLTARTFFRYFADKREVLFNGSEHLQQTMVDALADAPAEASAVDAIAAALMKAGEFFDDDLRPFSRLRSTVIAANADLRERELIKLARLSAALAQALRERGVGEPDASLAAEAGIAVFRVAFAQWVGEDERRSYGGIVQESLARLRTLVAN